MNIPDYQFIQSLNVTKLTPEQLEQLVHKSPNYNIVNYDSLREQIWQIDENYPYSMPTWLISLTTVLGALIIGDYSFSLLQILTHFKLFQNLSIFWHKQNPEETEAMHWGSSQQSIGSPKNKATPEKARETPEMLGMDFSDFNKYEGYRFSYDGSKVATTSLYLMQICNHSNSHCYTESIWYLLQLFNSKFVLIC